MKLLITICARGGSKGIPGKNIRLLDNQPLIAYSIETAKKFAEAQDAVIELSTDSEEIARVAFHFGLATKYRRPSDLANDTAGKIEVLKDVLVHTERRMGCTFDYLLDLDVTSPLRNVEDLESGLSIIEGDEQALNLFSVNSAARNPYFNMVEQGSNGYYKLVKQGSFLTRQSAPKVYELNASFYIYRRRFFKQENPATISDKSLIYVMPHMCFDLDHPIDFEFMDFILKNKKLDFAL